MGWEGLCLKWSITLVSNKDIGATEWWIVSAQCTQFLLFTLSLSWKAPRPSISSQYLSSQSLSASYRIRKSFAKSMRSCGSPSCIIWTPWYRYGNMRSIEHSSFRTFVLGIYITHELWLLLFARVLKSLFDALLQQCPQKQLATVIAVIKSAASVFEFILLSHTDLGEYMGHVFGDNFGDKHARLPQHSSHFDNIVLPFYHVFSQAQSFQRHVRTHDWIISTPPPTISVSYAEYLVNGFLWLVSLLCHMQIFCLLKDGVW